MRGVQALHGWVTSQTGKNKPAMVFPKKAEKMFHNKGRRVENGQIHANLKSEGLPFKNGTRVVKFLASSYISAKNDLLILWND